MIKLFWYPKEEKIMKVCVCVCVCVCGCVCVCVCVGVCVCLKLSAKILCSSFVICQGQIKKNQMTSKSNDT